jgi:flagellar hook assembly protein FlgD
MTATATAAHAGMTQITLSLSAAAEVQARVLNLAGRPVALIAPQQLSAGVQTLLWNGRSSTGTVVPPGRYLVEVRASAANGATTSCIVPLMK